MINAFCKSLIVGVAAALTLLSSPAQSAQAKELLVVSYDAGREVWQNLGDAYLKKLKAQGKDDGLTIKYSFGGSAKQAGNIIAGQKADIVGLALPIDLDAIAAKGLLDANWRKRPGLPEGANAYTSTLVFITRRGNPLGIKDWPDLAKPGVKVITPNPKTGGGSKLNFLNPYGYVLQNGGTEDDAKALLRKIYANVPVLDQGARGSAVTFGKGTGDVFITWEAEGLLTVQELGEDKTEIVRPANSILAKPPISIIDKLVDERGTRAEAEALVQFAFSKEGQEIIADSGWRPADPQVAKEHLTDFPQPTVTWEVEKQFGSWSHIQKTFFSDGGIFDQIYRK